MLKPAIPENEAQRIENLHSLNILDTAAEERFDRLTRLATQVFNVPIALVSLVDKNRQWFKSCIGLDATETGRDISFCGHAILTYAPLVVEDALKDPRFADNPLVTGEPKIRFYAGFPLVYPDGTKLGTFCIIDKKPHEFSDKDIRNLVDLAKLAEREVLLPITKVEIESV